jgi:hypothetical protein
MYECYHPPTGGAMNRHAFLQGVVGLAASAGLPAQDTVPNSAGTELGLKPPLGACNCHRHIFEGAQFAPQSTDTPFISNARVEGVSAAEATTRVQSRG